MIKKKVKWTKLYFLPDYLFIYNKIQFLFILLSNHWYSTYNSILFLHQLTSNLLFLQQSMISWRHLKASVSTKKKQVMLYEYVVSVIVCSKDYFNTQIKIISVKGSHSSFMQQELLTLQEWFLVPTVNVSGDYVLIVANSWLLSIYWTISSGVCDSVQFLVGEERERPPCKFSNVIWICSVGYCLF
jgi:ascorbate-specific PTS system EIIC-type component UlaA